MKALLTLSLLFLTATLLVAEGAPTISSITPVVLPGVQEIGSITSTNDDVYVRSLYTSTGPNKVGKILDGRSTWTRDILHIGGATYGHGLVANNGNLYFTDGNMVISTTNQGDSLWCIDLSPYKSGGLGFNLTPAQQHLIAYSMAGDLIIISYENGQIINNWHVEINGLTSCANHTAAAAPDSVFYLADTMPMGVNFNTGIKLTKIQIVSNVPEVVWTYEVPDLASAKMTVSSSGLIYLGGLETEPNWNNTLIFAIRDNGNNCTLEHTIDCGGAARTMVFDMKVSNSLLLTVGTTILGNDVNGGDGYITNLAAYNQDGSLNWQIEQSPTSFSAVTTITPTNDGFYVAGTSRTSVSGEPNLWLAKITTTTATNDEAIPELVSNLTNYPNPFNPSTTIKFSLAKPGKAEIQIFNVKGQLVKSWPAQTLSTGEHQLAWNGKDQNNNSISSGIYFCRITAGERQFTRKMTLMK